MADLTRRRFIKTTVASAALIPSPFIFPKGIAHGANDRIGLGMIGVGRQAVYSNLKWFLASEECKVLAVCDVDSWRLTNAKQSVDKQYNALNDQSGCAAYEDFRELLQRSDIDAVMISTPDHWHVPMAIAAARAKKDICCEKPLTLSIAEGRLLCDEVMLNKCVFRTDSEFRSIKTFHRAVALVRFGVIGMLKSIQTGVPAGDVEGKVEPDMPIPKELNYDWWQGPAKEAPYTLNRVHPHHGYGRPGWMRIRDYCEGMITNWGAHLNDIAQWGNNSEQTGPIEVEGTGTYPTKGLWNVLLDFECKYKFKNGVYLTYSVSRPYVRFNGTDGWIEVEFGKDKILASSDDILKMKLPESPINQPPKHEKQDFIDCVRSRKRTLADADVGHRTTSLCQIGHIAIQVGKKLQWDPIRERFTNSDEANKLLMRTYRAPWTLDAM